MGLDHLGDGVGEAPEAFFEVGFFEGEEEVKDVLGRAGVAEGEVGLEEVDAGGGAVAFGVVAGGNELDDGLDMAGGAEVAGNGDEHIGAVAGGGEDLLIKGEGTGEVAELEFLAGGEERGEDRAGDGGGGGGGVGGRGGERWGVGGGRGGRSDGGRVRGGGRGGGRGRGGFFTEESIEQAHGSVFQDGSGASGEPFLAVGGLSAKRRGGGRSIEDAMDRVSSSKRKRYNAGVEVETC